MANNETANQLIATAKFKDFSIYRTWWLADDKTYDWMCNFMDTRANEPGADRYMPFMTRFFRSGTIFSTQEELREKKASETKSDYIIPHLNELEALVNYAEAFNQPLNINHLTDTGAFIYLGNPSHGYYIPEPYEFLDIEMIPDYSALTIHEVRSLAGSRTDTQIASTLPANIDTSLSVGDVKADLSNLKASMASMEEEINNAARFKTEELALLKAEIEKMEQALYAKRDALMAELNAKKEELEAQMDKMNRQIYLLESEIYSIRCYLGDTVKFAKVRSGRNAPDDEPVVLHQKLRFLDEDLGRMISLYNLHWDDRDTFEHFLAHSPAALDTFAPNERCVTLVRLSRSGTRFGNHETIKNALQRYEAYHGKAIGIIIRNGENLYMGWTDDEKVHIQDDFVMDMKSRTISEEPARENETESEYKARLKKEQAQATKILDGIISRVFIFNILQGIVDNSDILPLPKGVVVSRQSEYIQFSLADMWLTDNRFGSLDDIIARCNAKLTTGDMILSVQNLSSGRYYNRGPDTWQNERGRGERNRLRDCQVNDCTIYPLNLIEQDDPVTMVRYKRPNPLRFQGDPEYYICTTSGDGSNLAADCEILETYEYIETHYYVSVKKEWSYHDARSNFEVYPEEIINLTYLNSVWLTYAISTKKLGGWTVGGKAVDYAYAIRYLNTALDFIRKREVREKELLDRIDPSYTTENPEWPLALSEWKLESGVRVITEYQAKRFIKNIRAVEKGRGASK